MQSLLFSIELGSNGKLFSSQIIVSFGFQVNAILSIYLWIASLLIHLLNHSNALSFICGTMDTS
jgi:hypothetical protein